jgi:hypothetical protein
VRRALDDAADGVPPASLQQRAIGSALPTPAIPWPAVAEMPTCRQSFVMPRYHLKGSDETERHSRPEGAVRPRAHLSESRRQRLFSCSRLIVTGGGSSTLLDPASGSTFGTPATVPEDWTGETHVLGMSEDDWEKMSLLADRAYLTASHAQRVAQVPRPSLANRR